MSVMSNNTTSATSTTEGFQIDTSMNMTLENSTGLSLDKGNTTLIDDEEVYRFKKTSRYNLQVQNTMQY